MTDLSVFVESDDTSSERRINQGWTIATLKEKLWPITGVPPVYQKLSIPYRSEDDVISSFNLEPLSVLKVGDSRPKGQRDNYTDDSNVQKFELTEEEYESRTDSVLAFKKRNQMGRFDPNAGTRHDVAMKELHDLGVVPGARCRIEGESDRRGTILYVGLVPQIPSGGIWVGVRYDEPVGKNDGSLNGVRYFDAQQHFGGFLRASKVQIGDYPPRNLEDELMDSEDEI